MIRELHLTPEQAEYLRMLDAAVTVASVQRDAAFTMLIRGHGLTEASTPRLTGVTLTVEVPDAT